MEIDKVFKDACEHGDLETVINVLRNKPPNIEECLLLSLANEKFEVVRILLNYKLHSKKVMNQCLPLACKNGVKYVELLNKFLLSEDVLNEELIKACYKKDEPLISLLLRYDATCKDEAFRILCKVGANISTLLLLIKSGVKDLESGLTEAYVNCNIAIISLLSSFRVKLTEEGFHKVCHTSNFHMITLAVLNGANDYFEAFCIAVEHSNLALIEYIETIDLDEVDWRLSLKVACENGNVEMILKSIECNADNYNAGLVMSCRGGYMRSVKIMLKLKADDYYNALLMSVKSCNLYLVKFFTPRYIRIKQNENHNNLMKLVMESNIHILRYILPTWYTQLPPIEFLNGHWYHSLQYNADKIEKAHNKFNENVYRKLSNLYDIIKYGHDEFKQNHPDAAPLFRVCCVYKHLELCKKILDLQIAYSIKSEPNLSEERRKTITQDYVSSAIEVAISFDFIELIRYIMIKYVVSEYGMNKIRNYISRMTSIYVLNVKNVKRYTRLIKDLKLFPNDTYESNINSIQTMYNTHCLSYGYPEEIGRKMYIAHRHGFL